MSAVFCGKKVILPTKERLSSVALMYIHCQTDSNKQGAMERTLQRSGCVTD